MPGFASTNPETPSPGLDEERKREVRVKDGDGSVWNGCWVRGKSSRVLEGEGATRGILRRSGKCRTYSCKNEKK